jgi:hypothetical protein
VPRTLPLMLMLLLFVCAAGCSHRVYPPQRPQDPVRVYLADYGWHSGVLLPLPDADGRLGGDGQFIEFTYGDWAFMLYNRTGMLDGVGALLVSRQAGFGRRVIAIRDGNVAPEVKGPPLRISPFYASAANVRRLTGQLEARHRRYAPSGMSEAFDGTLYVKDRQRYWLANNCNHAARRWLTALGCDVRGSVFTLGFGLAGDDQEKRNESSVATPAPPWNTR